MWRVLRKKSLYLVCRAVIRAGLLRANPGVSGAWHWPRLLDEGAV